MAEQFSQPTPDDLCNREFATVEEQEEYELWQEIQWIARVEQELANEADAEWLMRFNN